MHDVSRTLSKLQMIAGKPDWFTALFAVVIGQSITLVFDGQLKTVLTGTNTFYLSTQAIRVMISLLFHMILILS